MMPSISNETNIKLPLSFIIFSLIAFCASQVILLFNGHLIVEEYFRSPAILSAVHLLVLGWALMVAMGAMYQLVPVAFLTPIWSETFGFFQFGISAIGIAGFAITLSFSFKLAAITGIIAVLGILLFIFQMFMTMKKQAKKNILTLLVGSALACLLITITLGILLAVNMGMGLTDFNHIVVLKSHILLGITGWFTLLIFGFSYKMVPMFSLAHGFSMKPSKWVYIVYVAGLVVSIISFITEETYLFQIGLSILFIGFSIFSYHIYLIIKARLKKKLDKPFTFSLYAISFGLVIHGLAMVLSFFPGHYRFFGLLIYLYIFCWIVCSILGYLYKIIPFLWWTHRYSKEIGKSNVPTLKQLIDEKLAYPIFYSFLFGVLIVLVSIFTGQLLIFTIGQGLVLVATFVFSYTVINVLRK
ncbi:hypothetical protein [Fredinandcohnia quinoae]|uniref:Cytochrome C and Quinol oxidase polypeptide I n=1 Tax=Fredinandcohnia quinoae TaxID=2918902 RepID=A0AAW5E3N0_9BACI|nr:hypothetical protein [Fredinandcohnia sp. SECRCQ15]MCH1625850.1 hypothetical protein [Fredinandcohnia sp. SECRCQ15]